MRQAAMHERLGQVREQEQAYHRAVEACPDCPAPYLGLGHLWQRQGQLEGALGWYTEAARRDPENASAPYHQAQALYEGGDAAAAVQALERALALHRDQPWQWAVQLGDWRRELGDGDGALDAYRQALEWQPGEQAIEERILELDGPSDQAPLALP
jgi:tetratricopeptide (TPR) repeat protein